MKRMGDVGLAVIIIGVIAIVLSAAVIIFSANVQSRIPLNIGDGVFTAKLANTPSLRAGAVSGVTDLSNNQALIMAYPSDSKWTVSVSDIKTSMDIVWIDSNKKIVYIVTNASPDNTMSSVFAPKSDARYVVILPAGSTDNLNIKSGRSAVFDLGGTAVQ